MKLIREQIGIQEKYVLKSSKLLQGMLAIHKLWPIHDIRDAITIYAICLVKRQAESKWEQRSTSSWLLLDARCTS